jgi:hypothetical protein
MKLSIPKLTKREGRHGYFIRIKNPATGKRTWSSLGNDLPFNHPASCSQSAPGKHGALF